MAASEIPVPPAALDPGAEADARLDAGPHPASPAFPALGVWKGRGWELGFMVAAAGLLVCLAA